MNLKNTTLQRYANKYEKLPDDGKYIRCFLCPSLQYKTIFCGGAKTITEKLSHHFSKNASRIKFAEFAYNFAVINSITVPDSWKKKPVHGQVAFFLQMR